MSSKIIVYEVPTEAGTHFHGQCYAPRALKQAGLQSQLEKSGYIVETRNVLENGPVLWQPSPLINGVRNEEQAVAVLKEVQNYLIPNLPRVDTDTFSLIVGGDCSITVATMSALTHAYPDKTIGIMYVDNDVDLTIPIEGTYAGATGILDSMTFSNLTQRESSLASMKKLSRPDGSPTVTRENIVVFGLELVQPRIDHFGYLLDNHFRVFSSNAVRKDPSETAKQALKWLEERVDMILIHFDIDVIDSAEFPLGNYPSYGGIGFDQVMIALEVFLKSEKAMALSITEVNPNNDHNGDMIDRLVRRLVKIFEMRKKEKN